MSLDAATVRALRALARRRTPEALSALLYDIRSRSEAELMAAAYPPPRAAHARSFAAEITARLKPIIAPSDEKAALLAAAIDGADSARGGLASTIRALAKKHGEDAVAAAANRLLAELAIYHRADQVK